jgi:hypothetical protein
MEIKDILERLTSRKASEEAIREIIEYHVTAALKAASETKVSDEFLTYLYTRYGDDKNLILNAYPPDLIK